MNTTTIRDLEKRLWDTADELRANTGLKASEYSTPILGLIFLKFADSKYTKYEEDIASKIKEAIEGIEKYSQELVGILPKDSYHNLSREDNNKVLNRLLRNFNDIPTDTESDIFGEIYEYFLGNFALSEGQGGGEFFTPRTVVQYMVEYK